MGNSSRGVMMSWDQEAEECHEGQFHDEAQSGADRAVGVGVRGMGPGPGSENGRGRRSHRGSAEPNGAAAPGRAGDQEPPGARRVPHGAAAQVPATQDPAASVRRRIDPDRRRANDHAAVRRRFHDRGARSPAHRQGLRGRHRFGLPVGDPFTPGQGGVFGRDSCPALEAGDGRAQGAWLYQYSHPGRRRLRGLAGRGSLRRDHCHLRSAPDPQAAAGPAQGGWPDGDSAGRPVHAKRPPGHQAGRQADRQGAQAHTFRADDRQGTQGEGRDRSGPGSGSRSGSTPAQAQGRRRQARELGRMKNAVALLLLALAFLAAPALAQEPEIERPGPPAVDDLEQDANKDGIPDGWYNAREAIWEAKGGIVGPHYVRFACTQRGRPARLSRAFGVDGRKTEAIILGLWVKLDNIQYGERAGEEPSMLIDFLGDSLKHLSRGTFGPWTHTVDSRWTRVVKRIAVPPGTRDAIMSVGLMGAKGILDIDGLTIDLVPLGESPTTNLIVNGDFELGDPAPAYWIVNNEAQRVFPGHGSQAAIELARSGSRVLTGLSLPVDGLGSLEITVFARGQGLRGGGGAGALFFFLDNFGRPIAGSEAGVLAFEWAGSFEWRKEVNEVRVPPGATRAVIQLEKSDTLGRIQIDDVVITAAPNPDVAAWAPFHADEDTDDWLKVPPSPPIAANSALDFSFLVPAPAGRKGFVTAKDGRLSFDKGGRARFHGVSLIAPTAFLEPDKADELADRLARSGINLVRLGDLDLPIGPDRSLFDDSRDDTKAFDPLALQKLDHLVAALKARGIHVALELQSNRRFRDQDGVASAGLLPAGGGPAALFDPTITKLGLQSARSLLSRVNSETSLALKDDPALVWVTLLGEVSLFDLIDHRDDALPGEYAQALSTLAQKGTNTNGTGRRFWQSVETAHYKSVETAH